MILNYLFCILLIELLISLYIFRADVLSPAIIFNFVFTFSSFDLLLMKDKWRVALNPITLVIIITGTAVFNLTAYVVDRFRIVVNNSKFGNRNKKILKTIMLPGIILNFAALIYLFTIIMIMVVNIRSHGLSVAISTLLKDYSATVETDDLFKLPWWLSILYTLCVCIGYAWAYLLANEYASIKKIRPVYIILIIESIILGIANGKRGEGVALVATLAINLIFAMKKNKNKKLSRKVYAAIIGMFILVIIFFQLVSNVLGRDSVLFDPLEYISIYIGAPILNLDTSIKVGGFRHPVFLSETFRNTYRSIGSFLGIDKWMFLTDRKFMASANGQRVGNVHTIFYDFYHDAGICGVIVLTMIMAYIICKLYKHVKKGESGMLVTMIYGYMTWLVARSFFSNSFYEWFALSTIKLLAIWWITARLAVRSIKI